MPEHTPPRFLLLAMSGFFWAMAGAALCFWLGGVVWPGGLPGLIAALGPGVVAVFVSLHIPAAITGVLLWQWQRGGMPTRRRVLLEAATLYFGLSVILGMFLNYLLVSVMHDAIGPVLRGAGG